MFIWEVVSCPITWPTSRFVASLPPTDPRYKIHPAADWRDEQPSSCWLAWCTHPAGLLKLRTPFRFPTCLVALPFHFDVYIHSKRSAPNFHAHYTEFGSQAMRQQARFSNCVTITTRSEWARSARLSFWSCCLCFSRLHEWHWAETFIQSNLKKWMDIMVISFMHF